MKDVFAIFILGLILSILITSLLSYPFMLLWNACLVPAVTTLQTINYWQTFGILILVQIVVSLNKHSITMKSKD